MRPETEEDVAQLIRTAREPLSPVGGGTRLRPGEGQGERLNVSGLAGVTLYEPAALTLVVRAGTQLDEADVVLPLFHRASQHVDIEVQHAWQVGDTKHQVVQAADGNGVGRHGERALRVCGS